MWRRPDKEVQEQPYESMQELAVVSSSIFLISVKNDAVPALTSHAGELFRQLLSAVEWQKWWFGDGRPRRVDGRETLKRSR